MKIAVILAIFLSSVPVYVNGAEDGELARYHELRKIYLRSVAPPFGSGAVRERELREYCYALTGKTIRTESDFHLESPGSPDGPKFTSRFTNARWLVLEGPVDQKSFSGNTGKGGALPASWWRSKKLLALSGKIRRARPAKNSRGPVIEILLESIIIHDK